MSGLEHRLAAERRALAREAGGGPLARLRAVPGLREATMVWLMRAGMLAYMLGVVKAVEALVLALRRWL
jgi:hypothetical protein